MSRRKPELQALDLASWPAVAWTDLDAKTRKVINFRMQAIERFARGEPVKGIEQSTGVNRRQLYRWLERGLSHHPDGRIFGFRGLHSYVRVTEYARLGQITVRGERGSRGTAGAFSQLLERYPSLSAWLRLQVKRRRVTLEQIHTEGRLHTRLSGLQPLLVEFLWQCRSAGLTVGDYPFNTRGRAIRSLAAHLKAEMLRNFATGARAAGASNLKGIPRHALSGAVVARLMGPDVDPYEGVAPRGGIVDVDRLRENLDLPEKAPRGALIEGTGRQRYSDAFRFCRHCLTLGYHSVVSA